MTSKPNGKRNGKPKGRPGRKKNGVMTSPKMLEARLRHGEALVLRLHGVSYPDIASRLGFADASGAYRAIESELERRVGEPADRVKEIERARLDRLLMAVMPLALQGVLGAVDRVLRIMERRSRMDGLDAPIRHEVDWREEARKAGLTPSEEFERMVAQVILDNANRMGNAGSGEPPSS